MLLKQFTSLIAEKDINDILRSWQMKLNHICEGSFFNLK